MDGLWSRSATGLARDADFEPGTSIDAEVDYGLDTYRGVLTSYTGVSLSESGGIWSARARFKLGSSFDVNFEAIFKESAGDEPESGVFLRGSKRW